MPKGAIAALAAALLVMFSLPAPRKGVEDAFKSLIELRYPPIRDMRRTVALQPQKAFHRLPDDASVPTTGREAPLDRDLAAERMSNPVPAGNASIARGDSLFKRLCTPCHGRSMVGDGPVAAQFMPPPDLLGEQARGRKDGYLYSYIRNGGVVMPSYGFQLSAEETWHVINYIRRQQQASPR